MSKLLVLIVTGALAVGCGSESSRQPLAPTTANPISSSTGAGITAVPSFTGQTSLLGTWAEATRLGAAAITLPNPNSCSDFQFTITNQTPTSATGTFTTICPGNVTLSGAVSGQLGAATIPLTFNGLATMPGEAPCPFTLNGTGHPQSTVELRVDFTGTTCLGPASGSVTLRLAAPSAPSTPPPAPAPTPAPTPAPAPTPTGSDPLLGCGVLVGGDPFRVIECIHDRLNAPHTPEGAFEVTKRVAWAYRNDRVGLLIKNGGENIVSWKGYSFAAARVCMPDGHIFKILSDVPTTNGPSLQDNGFVDPSLYVAAIDPRN